MKVEYRISFWTKSGGISRNDEEKVRSIEEVEKIIFNDLIEQPYINFWYGQYIDVENLSTKNKIQIYTRDENSPVKMELTINGNSYNDINSMSDNTFEIVTDGLFEVGEVILNNKELTEAKLLFINNDSEAGDNYEFYLDYKIDYSFLIGL